MEMTRSIFESQRRRRFGTTNPERMSLAFWEWMIREIEESRLRANSFDAEADQGVLGHTPSDVRKYFGQVGDDSAGPIWNFDRMGATRTPHPDGRVICIAGKYGDHHDPDFGIYNDVVVLDLDGSIAIYGYPSDLFPPTDFHSATLLGDRVIIIGRLGDPEERQPGTTPVFALDLVTYRIDPLPSHGELPGWIFRHEAELGQDRRILIRGGEVFERKDDKESRRRRNLDDFAYDMGTGRWMRLTNRNWRQFSIRDVGGGTYMKSLRPLGCRLSAEWPEFDEPFIGVARGALFPRNFEYEVVDLGKLTPDEKIVVAGIPISITFELFSIGIIVEGEMDEEMASAIAKDIRDRIEAETGRPCELERDS